MSTEDPNAKERLVNYLVHLREIAKDWTDLTLYKEIVPFNVPNANVINQKMTELAILMRRNSHKNPQGNCYHWNPAKNQIPLEDIATKLIEAQKISDRERMKKPLPKDQIKHSNNALNDISQTIKEKIPQPSKDGLKYHPEGIIEEQPAESPDQVAINNELFARCHRLDEFIKIHSGRIFDLEKNLYMIKGPGINPQIQLKQISQLAHRLIMNIITIAGSIKEKTKIGVRLDDGGYYIIKITKKENTKK